MKKKFGSVIVSSVMACAMAASICFSTGCGPAKIADFEMPEGGYDGSKVSITFAATSGQTLRGKIEDALVRFNELYPNITVTLDTSKQNYDELNKRIGTQLTSNKQPNIAFCYSDHIAQYNRSGAVVALDEFFLPGSKYEDIKVTNAKGETESLGLTLEQVDPESETGYIKEFFDEGSVYEDGHTYTLPFAKSTEVMYYNKTFFDTNNLTVPTTWDEMETVCEQIIEILDGDKTKYPFYYDSDANWFITMCQQLGSPYTSVETGKHFLFDNEDNRDFVSTLHEWYKKGYFLTQATNGDEYGSNYFKAQNCFMSIGSTGGAAYQQGSGTNGIFDFEVGVARVPQKDPSNSKSILQGPSVCIFKDNNPQKVIASWLLVKFLTTDIEFQGNYSIVSGYIPVTKAVFNTQAYQTFLASNTLIARTAAECKRLVDEGAFYTSPAFVGSSKAREQVELLMKTALPSGDINKAFTDALTECRYFAGN